MSLRIPIALSLSLLLALTLVGAGPVATRAAQQPDESIPSDFQVYVCPEGYSGLDYLDDCSPAGAGDFSITATDTSPTEPSATTATDADGYVEFATFPGPTSWSLNAGGAFDYYFSCFDGNGVYLFDGASDLIQASLNGGDALACRWYVTPNGTDTSPRGDDGVPRDPADASVGVQLFDCPEGYDGDQYADDCAPTTRPVGVSINDGYEYDEATMIYDQAGDDGRAGFVDLQRGQYYLAIEDLSETTTINHDCTDVTEGSLSEGNEIYGSRGIHNRIRFNLNASGDASCQIFLTANGPVPPEPGTPGTVTLSVFFCPESYRGPDWSTACTDPIDSNYAFLIDPADPENSDFGDPAAGVEIFEGTAIFEDVPADERSVATGIPGHSTEQRSACVIGAGPIDDGLIDDNSTNRRVTLAEGEGATCVVYITPISLRA